jgi:hypothetical protein
VRLHFLPFVFLVLGTVTPSLNAASGVYTPGPNTLFYLPLDGPNAGAPENCTILNPALLTYIPDRFNNPTSAIQVSGTASPSDHFYITCPNTIIAAKPDPNQSLTVGYWTLVPQPPTSGGPRILTILATNSDNGNGGCSKYIVTEIDNGGVPDGCQGGLNGNIGQFISTTSVADGNWHSLIWVFDHGNKIVTLYIDGISNGTAALPDPSYTPENTQFIAGAENGSFALDGDLDDFWIEAGAWSATEVAQFFGYGTGNRSKQSRPIQLGTSGSNVSNADKNCDGAGTLGALLYIGSSQYILSANHVLALSNDSPLGQRYQPTRLD